MKVLVEFDLENRIHYDLYQQVKNTMLAHDRSDVKMPVPSSEQPPPAEITADEIQAAYVAASKANNDLTKKAFWEFRSDFGETLSSWTADQKSLALHTFKKLADNVADKF